MKKLIGFATLAIFYAQSQFIQPMRYGQVLPNNNVITYGSMGNTFDGRDNRASGYYNTIQGQQNSVSGANNLVMGSGNYIKSSSGEIQGSQNNDFIQGSSNNYIPQQSNFYSSSNKIYGDQNKYNRQIYRNDEVRYQTSSSSNLNSNNQRNSDNFRAKTLSVEKPYINTRQPINNFDSKMNAVIDKNLALNDALLSEASTSSSNLILDSSSRVGLSSSFGKSPSSLLSNDNTRTSTVSPGTATITYTSSPTKSVTTQTFVYRRSPRTTESQSTIIGSSINRF